MHVTLQVADFDSFEYTPKSGIVESYRSSILNVPKGPVALLGGGRTFRKWGLVEEG
jgi:hypothetical protein